MAISKFAQAQKYLAGVAFVMALLYIFILKLPSIKEDIGNKAYPVFIQCWVICLLFFTAVSSWPMIIAFITYGPKILSAINRVKKEIEDEEV